MIPAFKFHLNNSVLERVGTIGKYDGKNPCLTYGTIAGKVLIHNPREKLNLNYAKGQELNLSNPNSSSTRFLNINKKITSISSGTFKENDIADTLVIGTQSNILSYNVEKNSDTFYKDIPDGVNTLLFGKDNSINGNKLIYVGGNCSVQGFDSEGNESFWTVTGDNVTAATFCDINGNDNENLIVGSDDYEIRGFNHDEIISETTETSKIIDLTNIKKQYFGYALENGTVGIYKGGKNRIWRVKSKHKPITINSFDINGDGENEIIIGWNNGKIEARRNDNGEIIYKDIFNSSIACILKDDYRMNGNTEIICCSVEGEVRGYATTVPNMDGSLMNETKNVEEEAVDKLSKLKSSLTLELKAIEKNIKASTNGTKMAGSISVNTDITLSLKPSCEQNACILMITSKGDALIKSVIIFELETGFFNGKESLFIHPNTPISEINIPLKPTDKNIYAELTVQIIIGGRGNASTYHVFEKKKIVPKFAMFEQIKQITKSSSSNSNKPRGFVSFRAPPNYHMLFMWLQQSFVLNEKPDGMQSMEIRLASVRDKSFLDLSIKSSEIEFRTDDMQLASDLVQDICTYMKIQELESTADFPKQMDNFREILMKVDDFNSLRLKLTAEMADDSNYVKNLVIKAEDARLLYDMKSMRQIYTELFTLNNQLIGEYLKRSTNHQALLDALKEVNSMIQLAAKLRQGNAKTRVISACRKAIKENNIHALFYIITTGNEEMS